MSSIPRPDLSTRPLQVTCEYTVHAKPSEVYAAWTVRFDTWFAQAGTLSMVPEPGRPYFFYNRDEWGRHPHYGRFLRLEPDRLVELTWVTAAGTKGTETVVTVELIPSGKRTQLRLGHAGFPDDESRKGHDEAWPKALEHLDKAFRANP